MGDVEFDIVFEEEDVFEINPDKCVADYDGEVEIQPDMAELKAAVDDYQNARITYSIFCEGDEMINKVLAEIESRLDGQEDIQEFDLVDYYAKAKNVLKSAARKESETTVYNKAWYQLAKQIKAVASNDTASSNVEGVQVTRYLAQERLKAGLSWGSQPLDSKALSTKVKGQKVKKERYVKKLHRSVAPAV